MDELVASTGMMTAIVFSNMTGYLISVVLHDKSVAKQLKYKVRASMSYARGS